MFHTFRRTPNQLLQYAAGLLLPSRRPIMRMSLSRLRGVALLLLAIQCGLIILWFTRRSLSTAQDYDVADVGRKAEPPSGVSGGMFSFEINKDVLVFYHIQKTGGTYFNTLLVENIDVSEPCLCSTKPPEEGACRCRDEDGYTWLYSRFTTSSSCGVHPPLQELKQCAQLFLPAADGYEDHYSRRFMFLTILRQPVERYLSEWQHVENVGQWPLTCKPGNADMTEVTDKTVWTDMTLDDFIAKRYNPASNRQVRMLGSKYGDSACVDHEDSAASQQAALERAKNSLNKIEYFALLEHPEESQRLFLKTFGIGSHEPWSQSVLELRGKKVIRTLPPPTLEAIQELNRLDVELYHFAKTLFFQRLNAD